MKRIHVRLVIGCSPAYGKEWVEAQENASRLAGGMVGNEGRTRVPVYDTLTQAGFDPDHDMRQVPVMQPSAYVHANSWAGMPVPCGANGIRVGSWSVGTCAPVSRACMPQEGRSMAVRRIAVPP
jgi:hypothetical protein